MTVSNKNFIKRLKKQKEDALEYVIDEYMPFVKAIALKILQPIGKRDSVDDCINDVFLEVWKNSHQFNGEEVDFKKWIGIITKYKAIDYYRVYEKQAAREKHLDELEQISTHSNLQKSILEREQRSELLFELSKLDELDRDIFIMKYFLGLNNSEIATSLHLTKSAVDNRLYRGKKKLAKNIKLKEQFII
ncbi:sigma-70 family RNA polymerase sigma factor [Peribacillus asahii]|uniref:RNA polymerase factor sigma-70 n=1 Tax=Peribacillus asahii TaxID=228899 RepID=A0A3T0KUJ8_9BACI|nr:sigma-70 family RNA polymerase sigma factor [Peribacillus asahii]AZV43874.1 RNA polymerase factor sigma-70 [Peribacillus asahii]USK83625.1 sigma-70 family RNA polymerase sigma factor [Peribacillus asahii]